MIQSLKEANLPGPEFKEEFNGFSLYIRKNIYTREKLIALGLNDRQIKAVIFVKEKGKITNKEYQEHCNVSSRTAISDLSALVSKGVFVQMGVTGKGTAYILKMP